MESFSRRFRIWLIPRTLVTLDEGYAIVASVTRFSHMLPACGELSLFTDHKNILDTFSPTRFNANVARHIVHKTQRWDLRLAEFNFTVEHVPGAFNTWADLLIQ